MRVNTHLGNVTAPAVVFGIFIPALENAAKYERSHGHLSVSDDYLSIAQELKEGLKHARK